MLYRMAENKEPKEDKDFKYFVRIANTDLDGKKPVAFALTKIKGVGVMLSSALCNIAKVDKTKRVGYLEDADVKKLDEIIANPLKHDLPAWMINRRKSYEDGKDYHLISAELTFTKENDIKRLKKVKSYRGIRHGLGLPLRGQRTKSNFRRNKGKGSLGVKKKAGAKSGK